MSDPTLTALGALTAQEQGNGAVAAGNAGDVVASLGAHGIERQLAQQRLQGTVTSI